MVGKALCKGSGASQILGVMMQSAFIWALCRLVLFKTSLSLVILNPFTPPCPVGTLVLHLFGDRVLPALSLSFARENFEDAAHGCCFSHICCLLPAPTCFISAGCVAPASVWGEELFFLVSQERDCTHEKTEGENYHLSFFFWDLEQEFMDLGSLASAASTEWNSTAIAGMRMTFPLNKFTFWSFQVIDCPCAS